MYEHHVVEGDHILNSKACVHYYHKFSACVQPLTSAVWLDRTSPCDRPQVAPQYGPL
ncbi:hypothetical protein C8Q74DRAFT_1311112, partial [Fomes fomentarius]